MNNYNYIKGIKKIKETIKTNIDEIFLRKILYSEGMFSIGFIISLLKNAFFVKIKHLKKYILFTQRTNYYIHDKIQIN